MKKFGITLLCACVAVVSVLFSYYMTRATGSSGELSVETVYAMAQNAGYCGTLTDFINEFKGAVGNDGRGIASAEINSDGHLIITYTDMTTIDAGLVSADTINASGAISGLSLNYALTSSVSICCRASEETSVSGAGIIYALDKTQGTAYVMTNYHVLYNDVAGARFENSSISVYLYGMEYPSYAMSCEYVGGSVNYDIAILKISNSDIIKNSSARAVQLGNSELVSVADTVMAIGNPGGNGMSVTCGNVNVESENKYINTGASGGSIFMRVIRIDAAVNKGNSGGGLYDSQGKLIGIITAKNSNDGIDNIAYAIPINVATSVAENILYYCDGVQSETGYVIKMGIGLEIKSVKVEFDEVSGRTIKREEIAVKSVESGSYAERVGLRIGDVIKSVSVDGKEYNITREHHTPEAMLTVRAGSSIVYNVLRSGEELSITMVAPSELAQLQ